MKTPSLLTLAGLAFFGLSSFAHAEDKTTTFKVSGMVCASCESSLKDAVTKLEGVKKFEADAEKQTAVVSYDAAKLDEAKIAAAINATKFKIVK
jgi:copper chaperone CopZ